MITIWRQLSSQKMGFDKRGLVVGTGKGDFYRNESTMSRWFLLCLIVVGCDRPVEEVPSYSVDQVPRLSHRVDYRSKPFRRLVIMGESTVSGGPWLQQLEERFADVLVSLIREYQNKPVEYINKGIGNNVISPRSPGYIQSTKPSALERYNKDVVLQNPDLVILCFGLNDMRAGMPVDDFVEDFQTIIQAIRHGNDPLIILTTVYHMTGFRSHMPLNQGSPELTRKYNRAIFQLAGQYHCLVADVWAAQGIADWLVHPDGVHPNKLGNLVIANCIFETLVKHCSALSSNLYEKDIESNWSKNYLNVRKQQADPFDPWWKSEEHVLQESE